MGQTVAVTSGNGGAGKTTAAVYLARAFAASGSTTLLWEPCPGLRACDLMLGADGVVSDTGDVLEGRVCWQDACTPVEKNLYLLSAADPFAGAGEMGLRSARALCDPCRLSPLLEQLRAQFGCVVMDLPAQPDALRLASHADTLLFCCTPDVFSLRACEQSAQYLRRCVSTWQTGLPSDLTDPEQYLPQPRLRLLVNRVPSTPSGRTSLTCSLTDLIETSRLQLIGVVPDSGVLRTCTQSGQPLPGNTLESRIFTAIAARTVGYRIPLLFPS